MLWRIILLGVCIGAVRTYRYPISCFSCASEEYEQLYRSSKTARTIGIPVRFDKMCNKREDVKNFSPAVRCDSACITVLEPQFFGGILNEKQPYTFIRGCATDVFAWAASRPAEVDFMHNGDICLSLPISEIWPDVLANDLVTVCSCTSNGCNIHDTVDGSAVLRPFSITVMSSLAILSRFL